VRIALKVVMQTDRNFVDVILLSLMEHGLSSSGSNTLVYIDLCETFYKITLNCHVPKSVLTCICFRSHLFRMTLKSREPHRTIRDVTPGSLSATDTCIVYHVSHFEASRDVILHTRYVSTCVGAGCGSGRGTKNKSCPLWSTLFLMCDMHKSSIRHIHDPVLSSLKM
jgi:hypothetical protein